jgi:hypothetical protein
MELNEIKKILYKEKPVAIFEYADKTGIYYYLGLEIPGENTERFIIMFRVPFSDLGDAKFINQMPAQLLIRYIVQ